SSTSAPATEPADSECTLGRERRGYGAASWRSVATHGDLASADLRRAQRLDDLLGIFLGDFGGREAIADLDRADFSAAHAGFVGQLHGRRGYVHRVELGGELRDDVAERLEPACQHGFAQRRARELEPAVPQIGHGRERRDGDLLLRRLLDAAQKAMLTRLGE